MWREGRPISGWGDYILGTRRLYLYNVGIREPIMPTDHRMVLDELIGEGVRRHQWYCKEQATCPIAETKGGTWQEGDSQFNDLKWMVKNPSRKERTTTAPWISDTTWGLEDHRTELGRKITENQQEHRMATQMFQAALKEDRRCRARKVGEEIELLVVNDQPWE